MTTKQSANQLVKGAGMNRSCDATQRAYPIVTVDARLAPWRRLVGAEPVVQRRQPVVCGRQPGFWTHDADTEKDIIDDLVRFMIGQFEIGG